MSKLNVGKLKPSSMQRRNLEAQPPPLGVILLNAVDYMDQLMPLVSDSLSKTNFSVRPFSVCLL